jgi:hypothetical protein
MRLSKSLLIILAIIIIGFASRFIAVLAGDSWLANFSAIGALALFSGTYLSGFSRWLIPLITMWLSDLILNNVFYSQYFEGFSYFGVPSVYLSFGAIILFAVWYMKNATWTKVFIGCIAAAIGFFIITNVGVWMNALSPYSKDFAGLITCFEMALPFFRNTLLSNLIYGGIFFGAYELIAHRDHNLPAIVTQLS